MEEFKKSGLISDAIDDVPKRLLNVDWPDTKVKASLGNVLKPSEIKEEPMITWDLDESELKDFYTLIWIDLDAPSRAEPIYAQVLHWLIVNIPGNDLKSGEIKFEYLSTGPPKDSGLHRFGIFVLKQLNGKQNFNDVQFEPKSSIINRPFFKLREFIVKYNLEKQALAGNFFQSEYDSYCDVLHKKFNLNNI